MAKITSEEVLTSDQAANVKELIEVLGKLAEYLQVEADTVYTFGEYGNPLRIRCIMDTLTDGSKVFNIKIT